MSDGVAIDSELFKGKVEATQAVRGQALRVAFDEVHEAEKLVQQVTPKPPVFVKRLRIRTTRVKIEEVQATLDEWLKSFSNASAEDGDANYTVTVAFYPTRIPDSW